MSDSSSDRNPIEVLAEQFVERQRRGERLTLDAFAKEHPDLEEDIRELFPVLIKIENVRPDSGDATGPALNGTPALERIGDYRILREVGRGGMGVVYEAEQVSLGRHVALKVLPSSALLDARQVDRFSREAKAAARLHHTNIVPVYGVGEQDGLYYYVMQFIQGLGLDQVLAELRALRKGGPVAPVAGELSAISVAQSLLSGDVSSSVRLPGQPDGSSLSGTGREYWQSVARIGAQVARALGHAHHQGTLHRDIKPSNLLLDARGNVWVTDFGLAKASDSGDLTSTGEIVGTLRYIPPERFEGHSDARGDIYSLGLTLYELLTLRPAYESEERHRLLERILRDDPPAPRKLDPSIPRDLETVVLKAMSRDPARRYAKADELAEDLDSFAEDRPILARRMSQVERFTRWCRRNPVVASLSAAVALLLVSVAVVASVGAHLANLQALRAEEAAQSEERQRRTAEASAAENQAMLGKQLVAQGERLMDQGDLAGSLVYFTEALRRDPEPTREREHRVRVGNTLRQTPRPAHVLDHGSSVREMALSPDGKQLATVGDDGKVHVWNLADGSAAGEPLDHGSPVNHLAFTPDGKRLISTSAPPVRVRAQGGKEPPGPELRVWDLATRRPTRLPFAQGNVFLRQRMNTFDAALSRAVLVMEEQKAQVFDLATGTPASPVLDAGSTIVRAGLSPDGSRVQLTTRQRTDESGRGGLTVPRLLDARTGQEIRLEGGVDEDVRSSLAFNFLPGGRVMTVQSGVATCWDAGTGKKLWTQLLDNNVFSQGIDTSADGRRVLLSNTLRGTFGGGIGGLGMNQEVLDVATGRRVGVFTSGQGVTPSLSPDGRSATRGAEGNAVEVVDVSTGRPLGRAMRHAAPVQTARFSHDGQLLLTLAGAELRVWDAASGEPVTPILVHEQRVRVAEFTADDSHVACVSGGHVRLWPVHATPPGDHILGRVASIGPPQLSADGRRVLTVRNNAQGGEAFAQVWDAATARVIARRSVADLGGFPGLAIVFSPDGRRVLFYRALAARITAPSPATEAHLWDVDQDRLLPLPDKSAGGVTGEFSPDGREFVTLRGWLPVGPGKGSKEDVTYKCQLWDAATGQPIGPVVTARRGTDTFRGNAPYVLWAGRPTLMVYPQRVLAKEKLERKEADPIRRFDLLTGKELPPFKVPAALLQTGGPPGSALPSVSADGRRLLFSNMASFAATATARMLLVDQETGELLRRWDIPNSSINSINSLFGGRRVGGIATRIGAHLSADGTRVAAVLDEDGASRARLWNADTGEAIASPLANELGVELIRFSPDGRKLATANEVGVVRLWNAADGRPATPPIEVGRGQVFLGFSQDGSVLFTRRLVNSTLPPINRGRGEVRLWSTASGQSLTPPMTGTRPLLARGPASRFAGFDGEVPDFVAAEVQLPGADRVALLDSGTAGLRDLTPTTLPVTELLSLATVLGGRRIDAGNLERRTEPEFLAGWREAAPRLTGELASRPQVGTAWHEARLAQLVWPIENEATGWGVGWGVGRLVTDPPGSAFAARWHLDRLIAADPANGQLYVRRAAALQVLGRDEAALADLTRAFEHKKAPYYLRGGILARLGRLKEAEADLARAIELGRNNAPVAQPRYALGLVRLKLGDRAGYAALCEAAVKELGAPIRNEGGLPLFLAAPEGARWLQEMDESDLVFPSFNFVTFNYYAAQQYRLEEYRSARNALVRLTPGEPGDARNWFVRAMAEKRLGDARSAKASLTEGVKVLEASRAKPRDDGDTAFDGAGGWLDRVAEDLLRKEAEELLKGK